MAPMIDMVFLLLVFFMCVSTLVQAERGIELELAESLESEVPVELSPRSSVSVDANGQPHIGKQVVSLTRLKAHLKSLMQAEPSLVIQVRADQQTRYQELKKVLKNLRRGWRL